MDFGKRPKMAFLGKGIYRERKSKRSVFMLLAEKYRCILTDWGCIFGFFALEREYLAS